MEAARVGETELVGATAEATEAASREGAAREEAAREGAARGAAREATKGVRMEAMVALQTAEVAMVGAMAEKDARGQSTGLVPSGGDNGGGR